MSKSTLSFLKKYSYLLGIFLFIIILSRVDLNNIWQNIKNINPLYLIIAALLDFPLLFFKAWCWNYIKKQQKIKYSLKDSFLMYGSGLYIGTLTPGKLGELAKIFYLKKDGHSTGKSLVNVVLDRLSDFVFLLGFIFVGSLLFYNLFHKQILTPLIIFFLLIFLFLIFLKLGLIRAIFKKLFYIFIPQKYQKSWKVNFQDFVNDLKIYKLKNYIIIFLITSLSWLSYYIQMFILAKGVGITGIPFLYLAITVTIAGLITLIPVSVSGIGTRDIALILLLTPLGIGKEQIIVFSALILLMYLFTPLIGLICWLIKPLKISSN